MKTKEFTTVAAGRLKGRKVFLPQTEETRPTKSIVKDSVFNTLQSEISDYAFVEVFAGSGSMGIEAYSRGADTVCFIEKSQTAYETLKANIKHLAIEGAFSINGDSFEKLKEVERYLAHLKTKAWFYIDPPFDIRSDYEDIYKKAVDLIANLDPIVTRGVIIEHRTGSDIVDLIGNYELIKRKKFGKTTLSYYLNNKE